MSPASTVRPLHKGGGGRYSPVGLNSTRNGSVEVTKAGLNPSLSFRIMTSWPIFNSDAFTSASCFSVRSMTVCLLASASFIAFVLLLAFPSISASCWRACSSRAEFISSWRAHDDALCLILLG